MKKLFTIFFLCVILIALFVLGFNIENKIYHKEYLRIHIRANSNLTYDQDIKYKIKDEIVNFLTPIISSCNEKKRF